MLEGMETFEHITQYLEDAFSEQPIWREHALIRKLQDDQIDPIASLSLSDTLELFKIHFLVRRGLYLLRERWRNAREADLSIGTIEIIVIPFSCPENSEKAHSSAVQEADLLEQYYMDLSNYHNTTEAEIELMLKGFWQRLQNPEDATGALQTLGLEKGASYSEIKAAFRKHAQKLHPDKGGDEHAFQSLTNARDTLLAQTFKR